MFAALLDTNVLWPSLQRDFLLSLAVEGLYRPLWSDAILEELEFHEARKLVERGASREQAAAKAAWLRQQMTQHFDDALVVGWEQVAPYGLPDEDDEHVLAAAVLAGAQTLVTANQRDFPRHIVPAHIEVMSAREFARDTVSVDPVRALVALETMAARRQAKTAEDLLEALVTRYRMSEVNDILTTSG